MSVEGTKNWTPDPDITPEALAEMRLDVLDRIIIARVGLLFAIHSLAIWLHVCKLKVQMVARYCRSRRS